MADMRSAGYAIRRRKGATNHLDAAGVGARVNLPTPEEALAGMARNGSPRVPMGTSAIPSAKAQPVLKGKLVPKKGGQAGDPAGPKGNKTNVSQETLGASHRVRAVTPPMTSPEAGPTQANGRVIPSSLKRGPAFGDGAAGARKGY